MADETCVRKVNGEPEAQQIKAFLEANEVPCALRGESLRMVIENGLAEPLAAAGCRARHSSSRKGSNFGHVWTSQAGAQSPGSSL